MSHLCNSNQGGLIVKLNEQHVLSFVFLYTMWLARFSCVGNLCMITGGRNLGRVGLITHRERHPGSFDIVHIKDTQGHTFATRYDVMLQMRCMVLLRGNVTIYHPLGCKCILIVVEIYYGAIIWKLPSLTWACVWVDTLCVIWLLFRLCNVFVIGKGNKPWISLPKGKGIKLTIAEERDRRMAAKQ